MPSGGGAGHKGRETVDLERWPGLDETGGIVDEDASGGEVVKLRGGQTIADRCHGDPQQAGQLDDLVDGLVLEPLGHCAAQLINPLGPTGPLPQGRIGGPLRMSDHGTKVVPHPGLHRAEADPSIFGRLDRGDLDVAAELRPRLAHALGEGLVDGVGEHERLKQ